MLALYFGYLIVQLVFLASVKLPQGMDLSSIIFSVTVFVVWSFLPVVAYIGAKAIGAKGNLPKNYLIWHWDRCSSYRKVIYLSLIF